MRFIIKDGIIKRDIEVELFLEDKGEGYVKLYGRNNLGIQRILVSFKNGTVYKHTGATMDGIKTDARGKILERSSLY